MKFIDYMKQIKKIKRFQSVPVLLVLNELSSEVIKKISKVKVDDYIKYPKNSIEFLSHIRLLIKIQELQAVLNQKIIEFQNNKHEGK